MVKFFSIVPHKSVYLLQRMGRFHKTLEPGLNFYIPFVDRIEKRLTLKEQSIDIHEQAAITKDNVVVHLDGVLFFKINDPYKANYSIDDYMTSLRLLAMTTMRSEVGKITLDSLFQSRSELNEATAKALEKAASGWGIHCERYEVLKIEPPYEIKKSMQYEAEAERLKRKDIILSEAKKISEINKAEGKKQASILMAEGEADAINLKALREKEGLQYLNDQIYNTPNGEISMKYILRHRYLDEYRRILEHANVTVFWGKIIGYCSA
jgi:regulator of protease activity HflC (stomatin/prohibitin superfamily)